MNDPRFVHRLMDFVSHVWDRERWRASTSLPSRGARRLGVRSREFVARETRVMSSRYISCILLWSQETVRSFFSQCLILRCPFRFRWNAIWLEGLNDFSGEVNPHPSFDHACHWPEPDVIQGALVASINRWHSRCFFGACVSVLVTMRPCVLLTRVAVA